MFKVKGNYPYPILLDKAVDYKTSTIKARYLYQGLKNGHKIKIECDIDNNEIKKLIEDKKVCYAVQIESPNAMYRKTFEFFNEDLIEDPESKKKYIEISLDSNDVIDYIDIGLALLVKEEIDNYQNEDFVDAYKGIKMKINKNEVLAVCQNVRQMIILNDEILKELHSIFNLQKDNTINYITYDPNHHRILIRVPEDIGNYYLTAKGNKEKIKVLNAIIFMPILTSIVNDMKDTEEEFSNRLWFKTLENKIKEIIQDKKITREELLENPYETAQMLMQNISVESINEFKKLLETQEGDDE